MYEFQPPLEMDDFSGGITDYYVQSPLNQCQRAKNYLITRDRKAKLHSRDGTKVYDSTYYRASPKARVSNFIEEKNKLYVISGNEIYRTFQNTLSSTDINIVAGSTASLPSDTGNQCFSRGGNNSIHNKTLWQGHILLTHHDAPRPVAFLVQDESTDEYDSSYHLTMGLPRIEIQGAIYLANDLKSIFNTHIASATAHTTAADTINEVESVNAYDLESLSDLLVELGTNFTAHENDSQLASGWSYHGAQAGSDYGPSLPATDASPDDILDTIWDVLTELKSKINSHIGDSSSHDSVDTGQTTKSYEITVTGSGASTYIYAFHFQYSYEHLGKVYTVRGPIFQKEYSSLTTSTKSIAHIPAITNGTVYNFGPLSDDYDISIEIYRSVASGATLYRVGSVTTGTSTFSDTVSDADIVENAVIYTDGGTLEDEMPPNARFIHTVNNVTFYGAIGANYYPDVEEDKYLALDLLTLDRKAFTMSKPGAPYSCPGSFYDSFESDITGINSVKTYPIFFQRKSCYRIEGIYDSVGGGNPQRREISKTVGSVSHNGIVQIPGGLVFPGEDAFYFTDGNDVKIISRHLKETYKNFVNQTYDSDTDDLDEQRIHGSYDNLNKRVYWCVRGDKSSSDNDMIIVLDLSFPITEESSFTTIESRSWLPCATVISDGLLIIGDRGGYYLKSRSNYHTDPLMDESKTPANWDTEAIEWDFISSSFDAGTTAIQKYANHCIVEAKGITKTTMHLESAINNDSQFRQLREIRFRDAMVWGDLEIPWGDTSRTWKWGITPTLQAKRRFPAGFSKFDYRQIRLRNADGTIYRSDDYDDVTIDATAKTVTLNSGTWPSDLSGYYISFDDDSYATKFPIRSRDSSTQLTVYDPLSELSDSSTAKWYITGIRKGERCNLISIVTHYALIDLKKKKYRGETLENA